LFLLYPKIAPFSLQKWVYFYVGLKNVHLWSCYIKISSSKSIWFAGITGPKELLQICLQCGKLSHSRPGCPQVYEFIFQLCQRADKYQGKHQNFRSKEYVWFRGEFVFWKQESLIVLQKWIYKLTAIWVDSTNISKGKKDGLILVMKLYFQHLKVAPILLLWNFSHTFLKLWWLVRKLQNHAILTAMTLKMSSLQKITERCMKNIIKWRLC